MKETGFWREGDQYIERLSQDVEPIIEHVKGLRGVDAVGSSEMRHAAKIPKVVIENYLRQHGISFAEFMSNTETHARRLLNDPALAGFRIWQGRV